MICSHTDRSQEGGNSRRTATQCSTLQQTATHNETHGKHCNTLQHTATHCIALQRTATPADARREKVVDVLLHTATDYRTLQHNATHCSTLERTTTHCNTGQRREEEGSLCTAATTCRPPLPVAAPLCMRACVHVCV